MALAAAAAEMARAVPAASRVAAETAAVVEAAGD